MFTKRDGIELKNPVISKKMDAKILKYYEKHKNFTSWDDFEKKWDIGFGDDLVAKANRKEKWFLNDFDKTDIIFRPQDYWDKEADRRGVTRHHLLQQEAQMRGMSLEELYKTYFNN